MSFGFELSGSLQYDCGSHVKCFFRGEGISFQCWAVVEKSLGAITGVLRVSASTLTIIDAIRFPFFLFPFFPCKLLSCTDGWESSAWKIICLWVEGLGANKISLEHYQNLPILWGDIPYLSLIFFFSCISTSYFLPLSHRIKWLSNGTPYSEIHLCLFSHCLFPKNL